MVQKIVAFDVALKSTERQWVQKISEVYTNDLGSVSIQFKITDCTDVELTGSTAIVLLKMRDGSFFQGPPVDVTRTLNVFSYTLKENEGNHDGLAEIQLVVTIATKEFATQKCNFKVITGLDSEVAREIMIYDWSTLTAEARAYIDQFTADEILRDAEFDNAQFDRSTAFNADQAARVTAFNLAEANRAAGYDADHSRAGTDHAGAETDRNLAATDHTTASGDHTTALEDHAVLGGFNGRLTDVETDTSLGATNLVTNGDFSNGFTGFNYSLDVVLSVESGELRVRFENSTGALIYPNINQMGIAEFKTTHKYYTKFNIAESNSMPISAFLQIGGEIVKYFYAVGRYSTIHTPVADSNIWYFNHTVDIGQTIDYKVAKPLIIDLTATFGAGNEPTVEQMDAIMAKFENSWFDGTKNLFQAKASLNKLMALDARTEFEAKNLVANGDFSNGTTGWTEYGVTSTIASGVLNATLITSGGLVHQTLADVIAQDKIYIAGELAMVAVDSANTFVKFRLSIGNIYANILSPTIEQLSGNALTRFSAIDTASVSGQLFGVLYAAGNHAIGDTMKMRKMTVINLTKAFGAGKEPTLAEMDRLMARFPNSWFDGVKPIQTIEQLYQEKAGKVQEDWITPTLLNSWTGTIEYAKNDLGQVVLRFNLTAGTSTIATIISNLAAGYRPAYIVGIRGNNPSTGPNCDLRLQSSGNLEIIGGVSTGNIVQSEITFSTN